MHISTCHADSPYSQTFHFLDLMLFSKCHLCLPSKVVSTVHSTSQSMLYPLEMPPNSQHLCIFSVTLDTVFPCLAAIQLSTASVNHGHNVFSVFSKQMSLRTFLMTHHHLHSPLSLKIPIAYTQCYTVKNYYAWELGKFYKRWSQKETGQWEFPIAS